MVVGNVWGGGAGDPQIVGKKDWPSGRGKQGLDHAFDQA